MNVNKAFEARAYSYQKCKSRGHSGYNPERLFLHGVECNLLVQLISEGDDIGGPRLFGFICHFSDTPDHINAFFFPPVSKGNIKILLVRIEFKDEDRKVFLFDLIFPDQLPIQLVTKPFGTHPRVDGISLTTGNEHVPSIVRMRIESWLHV